MNWIKRNIVWLAGLLVFMLVILASLFALKKQMEAKDRVQSDLDAEYAELKRLVDRPVYPDNKNVDQMRRDNDEMQQRIREMVKKLGKERVEGEQLTGIRFRETVNQRTQELSRAARKNAVAIPSDFLFGFERYERTIPDNEDVPLLTKQLRVIEEIATQLFESHILLLDSLSRVEFEDAGASEEARGKRRGEGEFTEMPNGYQGIVSDEGKMYTMMPFELQFATNPEGLREFVNRLTKSRYLLIPAYIKIECDDTSVETKVSKPEIGPEGEVVQPKAEEVEIAEETTKYVLGLSKINVQMKIDWYEFRPLPEDEKKEGGRKKRGGTEKGEAQPAAEGTK